MTIERLSLAIVGFNRYIVTVTFSRAELAEHPGPKYLAIADAIARDVANGRLAPGSQVPPQRDLARELGVTLGTVTRGYAEARRRGLLSGEVGRGTFVRGPVATAGRWSPRHGGDGEVLDLAHNEPNFTAVGERLRAALAAWSTSPRVLGSLGYAPPAGTERARRAGASWLERLGVRAEPDALVVTSGAQHAMLVALADVVEPGDVVLAEAVAYPGLDAIARLLRVTLVGVALDAHGLEPDAFARACESTRPKALYTTPTLQNPTATRMPVERRAAIAAIARHHAVHVVEDDSYGFLDPTPLPPLVSWLPEHGTWLTGLSKAIAPGLRTGFVWRPDGDVAGLETGVLTSTIMAPNLTADIAACWIEDGTAAAVVDARRAEIAERQTRARAVLGPHAPASCDARAPHLWLRLPEPWRAGEFAERARARGVALAPAEVFTVGRAGAPHAVRASLTATATTSDLERALGVVRELLDQRPAKTFGV